MTQPIQRRITLIRHAKAEDDGALQRMQKQIDELQSRVRKLEGARFRLDHKP